MSAGRYPGAVTSTITDGGFLALPQRGAGPFGAVIVCHERYGLVQHTMDLAARFAAEGYVGLAPDLFSGWKGDRAALRRGEARARLTDDEIIASLSRSLDVLLAHPQVDRTRIAVMGVCQSGGYPLLLNSVRPEVRANIVVYGGVGTDDDVIERITAPVLGIWGERDHVVSIEHVLRLRGSLEAHRKTYEFTLFRDMPHGWLNSTMPGRYRAAEAAQAWQLVVEFLGRAFSGAFPADRAHWTFQSNIAVSYDFTKNARLE